MNGENLKMEFQAWSRRNDSEPAVDIVIVSNVYY